MTGETSHERWTGQLDVYLDGELDSGSTQALDRHLRECPACAAEALRRLQWKRAIGSAGMSYTPDPALRERLQKGGLRPRQAWWQLRPAFAATAVVVALLAAGRLAQLELTRPKPGVVQEAAARKVDLLGELADVHVATLASANPVDVVSSDRHTVKPWFEGRVPFSFNLPELEGSEFSLVGGRVTYVEQSPGAQLLFRIRKHEISVFIFQAKDVNLDSAWGKPMNVRSFDLESWEHNGLQYFVIGDVAAGDLTRLRELLTK